MANPKCVALKCKLEDKDIFDKAFKPTVLEKIEDTVKSLVDKKKELTFKNNCKDGWLLEATVLSLTVDDATKPTSMAAKVTIDGVHLQGTLKGFKAKGGAKASGGMSAKNLEKSAASLVADVVSDMMTKDVLPHLLTP